MSAGDFDLIFDPLQLDRVRYLVVGGVAVVLHGHPRFTAGLGGVKVPVASIEDLVALKRAAGRPKDLEDIRVLEAIAREPKDG